jgi:hypothetical protein
MPPQPCTCVADFNTKLREHNTKIIETISIPRDGSPAFTRPTIRTEKIESRKRVGPAIAMPTFCPFCGTAYEAQPSHPACTKASHYLIWSNEHRCWWGPNQRGYTQSIDRAGRYTREEAIGIAGTARGGWEVGSNPSEIAIPEADAVPQASHGGRLQAYVDARVEGSGA